MDEHLLPQLKNNYKILLKLDIFQDAWQIKKTNPRSRMLYLSAEQFMYRFVQALRFKDMYGFKEIFRSVDILLVDVVQFIAGKESNFKI